MKNPIDILNWATDYLTSYGYSIQSSPETVVETPWSNVIRFITNEVIYLKQTPPSLFLEPKIIQLLANQRHASVPIVIASNDNLHCFLMKDAGLPLRQHLKTEFQPELLFQAIRQYTTIQRSIENHVELFFALDVPDWRLNKLPYLYEQLISKTDFLKSDGVTSEELQLLNDLKSKVSKECELLAQYQIPETLVQPDFNSNNILFDRGTQKMTLIDLGEIAITHPFFSLHNFLLQATIHHNVKESDQTYQQLLNACYENWLDLATKNQIIDGFMLAKKLWPVYSALAHYRLMTSVDLQAFKSFYANRPNRLAGYLREYAASAT
ncbi:MAG: uncharacterized protein K0S63_197 [Gammaproteobacteria bacterium]|nr:uncharacterized protein [Gammaproteobacteria bacterium]